MRKYFFRALVAMLLGGFQYHVLAQVPSLCVKQHIAAVARDGTTLGIALGDAEALIARVARSIGLSQSVSVVPCRFSSKAISWYARNVPDVPNGEYVIYNPDWVREVIGKDEIQAIALFGHELGHFVNRHFDTRQDLTLKEKETEADHFAGCAVARLKGNFATLENLLSRLRTEVDANYPNRLTSIESAKKGYADCGGDVAKRCRKPEHGLEGWGFETTFTRNSNWRGGGGSQGGYCAELTATARNEYPNAVEIDTRSSSENTRDSCSPFRCIQYQYTCSVSVRGRPIYKEAESSSCP